jgi:protein-tyrosine phosphatase
MAMDPSSGRVGSVALPRVLFVCTGNICRSPTAHALLANKARVQGLHVVVDSAAISDEEAGRPMDPRSLRELRRRGHAPLDHRARQVVAADFTRFDCLIGMTQAHCHALQRQRDALAAPGQVLHMLEVLPHLRGQDVPDPWYGGPADFVRAFDLIDQAVEALLTAWTTRRA